MPLVRHTYFRDIAKHGDGPVHVEDVEARTLIADRRAVLVTEEELAELKKAELADLAEQADVEVPKRGAKGQFVKALVEGDQPGVD
jgi:tRNA U54 and U55 pseudouridine synthase Pus10